MKKIMFSDRFGLTQAVLDGRKTMTRRMINIPQYWRGQWVWGVGVSGKTLELYDADEGIMMDEKTGDFAQICPKFKVGEVVAVAQSYNDSGWNPNTLQQTFVKEPTVFPDLDPISPLSGWIDLPLKYHKGWSNKMFVYAGLMPHQIRIMNVRIERLQDISDKDCIKEGILEDCPGIQYSYPTEIGYCGQYPFDSPRAAFAALIDKVSGKGIWQANPYCFCYTFELIR